MKQNQIRNPHQSTIYSCEYNFFFVCSSDGHYIWTVSPRMNAIASCDQFNRLLIVGLRIRLCIICIILHVIFSLIQKLLINVLLIISQSTFHYDSGYWSNRNEYNLPGGETGFDSQETKLATYRGTHPSPRYVLV